VPSSFRAFNGELHHPGNKNSEIFVPADKVLYRNCQFKGIEDRGCGISYYIYSLSKPYKHCLIMIMIISTPSIIEKFSGGNIHLSGLIHTWVIVFATIVVICFLVGELTRNYSQVDKLWSIIPGIYSWITFASFPSARLLMMALLVTTWGLRLSYNFSRKGGYSIIPWKGEEDYRWKVMRQNPVLKGRLRFGLFNLLFICFYQNSLILLFSSPLLIAAKYHEQGITWLDIVAGILMAAFIITETVADNQLFRFQQEKKNVQKVKPIYTSSLEKGFMTEGLWKYVRHPNFTSEQAIWISFYFFGVAASGRWINMTIIGPLLLVLLFIGSSQLTENISSSKYPDYAGYKVKVPRFFPGLSRH
jgi:steroid 5-alpha reductase family enzyme